MFHAYLKTDNAKTTLFIRLMVGVVFLSEGIQKILFPAIRGAGRFANIGFPAPEFFASFVAFFEIACGLLLLIGLWTRFASIPLIVIMLVAITSTKLEILLNSGFWNMMHAARTDWSMLLGSLFLLFSGGGFWSLDYRITEE